MSGSSTRLLCRRGTVLYVASGSTVSSFNVTTGRRLMTYSAHTDRISAVDVSEDENLLWTASWDGTVRSFNIHTGHCTWTYTGHNAMVFCLAVVDGVVYSGGASGAVHCFASRAAGVVPAKLEAEAWVHVVAASPQGLVFSGSRGRRVHAFELATGVLLWKGRKHHAEIIGLQVVGDTVYSAARQYAENDKDSPDYTVRAWNVHSGEQVQVYDSGDEERIAMFLVEPVLKLVFVAHTNGDVVAFNLETGDVHGRYTGAHDHSMISDLAVAGDCLFTCAADTGVAQWNIATSFMKNRFSLDDGGVSETLQILVDDKNVVATAAQPLQQVADAVMWDLASGQLVHRFRAASRQVNAMLLLPGDQETLVVAIDGSPDVERLYRESGDLVQAYHGHAETVTCLAVHDDRLYSGARDANILLHSLRSDAHAASGMRSPGEAVRAYEGHSAAVTVLVATQDTLYSGSEDGDIRLWHATAGTCLRTIPGGSGAVRALLVEASSTLWSVAADDTAAKQWDLNTGLVLDALQDEADQTFRPLALLRHQQFLFVGDAKRVRVFAFHIASSQQQADTEAASGAAPLHRPGQHAFTLVPRNKFREGADGGVTSMCVIGDVLWAGAANATVTAWRLSTRRYLRSFHDHVAPVSALAADASSPGDVRLYSASNRVYQMRATAFARWGVRHVSPALLRGGPGADTTEHDRGYLHSIALLALLPVQLYLLLHYAGPTDSAHSVWPDLDTGQRAHRVLVDAGIAAGSSTAVVAVALAAMLGFLVVFATHHRIRRLRFLHPGSWPAKRVWTMAKLFAWLLIDPLLVPVIRHAAWAACPPDAACTPLVGPAAVLAALFLAAAVRLLFVGLAWRNIYMSSGVLGLFDWSQDRFIVHYEHPLSLRRSARWNLVAVAAVRVALVLFASYLAVPSTVHVLGIIAALSLLLVTYRYPPYLSATANRFRSGFDYALLAAAVLLLALPSSDPADSTLILLRVLVPLAAYLVGAIGYQVAIARRRAIRVERAPAGPASSPDEGVAPPRVKKQRQTTVTAPKAWSGAMAPVDFDAAAGGVAGAEGQEEDETTRREKRRQRTVTTGDPETDAALLDTALLLDDVDALLEGIDVDDLPDDLPDV